MAFSRKILAFVWLTFYLWTSCAIQKPPTGGPKDENPPVVIKETPPNKSISFRSKTIEIEFDEYFSISNLRQELIISPPMDSLPEIISKGKKLRIEIKSTLKNNTTYSFNFGRAISDLNEGNTLDDYRYVFSTGSKIDSLELKGNVVDLLTGKKTEVIKIVLHPGNCDSCIFQNRPMYFARTNKTGEFVLSNLKEGTYSLYALSDENNNFRYDFGESISFIKEVKVPDSVKKYFELSTFKESPKNPKVIGKEFISPGRLIFAFSSRVDSFLIRSDSSILLSEKTFNETNDTVIIWLNKNTDGTFNTYYSINGMPEDTARIEFPIEKNKNAKESNLQKLKIVPVIDLYGEQFIGFKFSEPVLKINPEFIFIQKDTGLTISPDEKDFVKLSLIKYKIRTIWEEGSKYKIIIDKNAINSIYGSSNDSMAVEFRTMSGNQLGSILVKLIKADTLAQSANLILELLNDNGKILRRKILKSIDVVQFEALLPGKYKVRCILDYNGNEKWDAGTVAGFIPPEPVFFNEQELVLKANWELNTEIFLR